MDISSTRKWKRQSWLKLNQIIAVEKGVKGRAYSALTELNKAAQKAELFNGFSKTYEKKDEDSEQLPPESKRVQFTAKDVLRQAERLMSDMIETTSRKDWTNCVAKGDVVVAGKVLFKDAPVSFLLFMEKQLTDLRTLITNIPVLDIAENWTLDPNSGMHKTEAISTHRTKKVQKSLVLIQPTVEHPGQAQMITDDAIVGFWKAVKVSGAVPRPDKDKLLDRVELLIHAIKEGREAANMHEEVEVPDVGTAVFGFLFEEG